MDTEQSTAQDVGIVSSAICVRFLTGDFITKLPNGDWHYPKTEDVMQKAGLKSIKQYIEQRRTNVEEYMTMESESIRIGVRKDSDI